MAANSHRAFAGGVSVFALIWLLLLRLDDQRWKLPDVMVAKLCRLRPWVITGVVVVVIQILLGGWTSSNYAAFACPDLPLCQGQLIPEMHFADGFNIAQKIGPNYLGGLMDNEARTAIHFIHRLGALVTTLYLMTLCGVLLAIKEPRIRRMGMIILSALGVQIVLGLGNVLFMIPLTLAVLHNAGGAILLLTLVTLAMKIWTVKLDPHGS